MNIIITGNPVDGFTYTGPFPDRESAIDAATWGVVETEADWWVADLVAVPEGDDQ